MPQMQRERLSKPHWLVGRGHVTPRPEHYHEDWMVNGRGQRGQLSTTRILKDAILLAAELTGDNGRGNGGLVGYLKALAVHEPKAFSTLLAKVMPYQVAGVRNRPITIITENMDQQQAANAYAETVQTITLMIEDHSDRDDNAHNEPEDNND